MKNSLPGADQPYILEAAEGYRSNAFSLLVTEKARSADTGGDFGLVEMAGVRGTGAPPHSHGRETEAFYILEGAVRVWVADLERLMHPGDYVHIPKKAPHMFRIESETAKFLCLITPGGFEHYFVELGEPTDRFFPPALSDDSRLPSDELAAEVSTRYDWHLEADWDPTNGAWRAPRSES